MTGTAVGTRIALLAVGALAAGCDGGGAGAGGAAPRPPADLTVDVGDGVTMEFVLVPAGTLTMIPLDDAFAELSAYQVAIEEPFHLARFEVTEEQWRAVMGENPRDRNGSRHPVGRVRWDECQRFVAELNATASGAEYFLPTDAQWEYACRAGSTTQWCFGDDEQRLGEYAWYLDNAGGTCAPGNPSVRYGGSSHPVGEKKPNAWGLYDMHGNVAEWCADAWHPDERLLRVLGSGDGSSRPVGHVVRGGSWTGEARFVRSKSRGFGSADTSAGFRVARRVVSARVVRSAEEQRAAAADAEAKAREILETYRGARSAHYPDPRLHSLLAIGRPAFGVVVHVLCDAEYADEWAMREAAMRALPALALPEDVPMLARRMREGHCDLERAFERLSTPEAVATYASLIREGRFGGGLDEAAGPHLRDPQLVQACCDWLVAPRYDGDMDFAIAQMAGLLGGLPPHRARGVAPAAAAQLAAALRRMLDQPLRIDARWRVAAALARAGDAAGIPVLIEVVGAPLPVPALPPDSYHRHAAGELLNDITGMPIYVGRTVHDGPHGVSFEGNFAEAAARFTEWWESSKDRLHFDPATQTWSVR